MSSSWTYLDPTWKTSSTSVVANIRLKLFVCLPSRWCVLLFSYNRERAGRAPLVRHFDAQH